MLILKNMIKMIDYNNPFSCKRCGACCRAFSSQVRYIIDPLDPNWDKLPKFYKDIIMGYNDPEHQDFKNYVLRFFHHKKFIHPYSRVYFIPSKIEFLCSVISKNFNKNSKKGKIPLNLTTNTINNQFKILLNFEQTPRALECLFLSEKDGIYTCTINEIHPAMCTNYPSNKGFVCINQKERYFSQQFFDFKKRAFSGELDLLKQMLSFMNEEDLIKCLDLIAFLIDYGEFSYEDLELFFEDLGWSKLDFKYAVKDLMRLGILYPAVNKKSKQTLFCISSTALKTKVKSLMNEEHLDLSNNASLNLI